MRVAGEQSGNGDGLIAMLGGVSLVSIAAGIELSIGVGMCVAAMGLR